jgi:hypothetical protein
MHPVEHYLATLSAIRRTGAATPETSYYSALETLLNEVGAKLKPKVRAISQLANTGAGSPDFGLYTASQFQRSKDDQPAKGQHPERGVIEVKGWNDDSFVTADTAQVSKYWQHYGLVLVTNYRDFVLVGRDEAGRPQRLETYRMSESETAFHGLLAHPRKAADDQGERMLEFLRRVLLCEAALTAPEDLAWFLASYAREARHRVEAAAALPALGGLRKAIEEALGMKFEGEKGDHFFQATFVQTLFYGVFSSWVLWCREQGADSARPFDWRNAAWTLHVPMVAGLFNQIATPQRLKPLGVDEVLDWAGAALNRVDRHVFFSKFEEEHAVQYFYEPFLQAYDPGLRKELGVWYTPPEIVQYQVERVDRVLREELDLADGLADDRVVILDPCCGTGAYLVETLKRIHRTLEEKGGSALTAQKLKKAAIERVFGFEILPAPFVIAHLQLGLMLRHLGAPLDHDSNQRAGVYLTNALTGWEPPKGETTMTADKAGKTVEESENVREVVSHALENMPELLEELLAAREVKRDRKILVIIGNPPYNAFAGTSPEEEGGLVDAYKEGLTTPVKQGGWGIRKFNLDDLYVRFFRIAERRIAKSGKGVVCYISNYSWTSEPSFVALRKQLLQSFDKFWIENMHGNRKISEYAPDGRTSETVFAIPGFSPGIQQGVVISLWVRRDGHTDEGRKLAKVLYRDDIDAARAAERRQQLLASLKLKNPDRKYETATPEPANRFSFRPSKVKGDYRKWPSVLALSKMPPSNGLMEKRGGTLIDTDRDALDNRMRAYFNSTLDWQSVMPMLGNLGRNAARYDAKRTRERLLQEEHFDGARIMRYSIRPFDSQWCYYSGVRPLWNESRPSYYAQCWEGNSFFVTRPTGVANPEGVPVCFVSNLGDNDYQRGHSYYFPIRLRDCADNGNGKNHHQQAVFEEMTAYHSTRANLSDTSRKYLRELGIDNPDADAETAGLIWMHALAIGYSPAYLAENADGIRQDWPRIPLPASRGALLESAALGSRVAALLDTEEPVDGVTRGKPDPRLKPLGTIRRIGGGTLNPGTGELDVTAGWGHAGRDGVCMPGRGKVEERKTKDAQQEACFGAETLDIYLNDTAFWENVPRTVWDYTIGGYQVIKKWLSYREKAMLGRGLTMEEADYVTEMIRRIAALIALGSNLDQNYRAVTADTWAWPDGQSIGSV